jgi:hypothetical protein
MYSREEREREKRVKGYRSGTTLIEWEEEVETAEEEERERRILAAIIKTKVHRFTLLI